MWEEKESPLCLLSIVGDDHTGSILLQHAKSVGIDISSVPLTSKYSTPLYMAVLQ